jgi:hypothetical protein
MPHKQTLAELIETLKQERDQLAVKVHLANAEARQEWGKLREKLDRLLADYEPARKAASQSAHDVGGALKVVAQEIKAGFERIRKAL